MYNSSAIAQKIKDLAKEKHISISDMLQKIELGRNTMANFKTSMPKADNLAKIADYLDCSTDYLLGRVNTPNGTYFIAGDNNIQVNGNNSPTTVTNSENKRQDTMVEEFIQIFENLSFEDKLAVMDFAMSKINK